VTVALGQSMVATVHTQCEAKLVILKT